MQAKPQPVRILVLGVSSVHARHCGVHDYARQLGAALAESGAEIQFEWQWGFESRRWRDAVGAAAGADLILLHYSVFAFAKKGIPLSVPALAWGLRSVRAPVVVVMHEYIYPWATNGIKGWAWAVSQRLVLPLLMLSADGNIVTTDGRRTWFESRWYLPNRPVLMAPVFPTLEVSPSCGPLRKGAVSVVGHGHESVLKDLVLEALAILRSRGSLVSLELLGSPGEASNSGRAWRRQAEAWGVARFLSFRNDLSSKQFGDLLQTSSVIVFPDSPGPTSRKTTLAASLQSGRPLVAIAGPDTWSDLANARALELVEPDAERLADRLASLLEDEEAASALGRRGRAFAAQHMNVGLAVRAVQHLYETLRKDRL